MSAPVTAADYSDGMHVTTAPDSARGQAHARLLAHIETLGGLDPDRPSAAERLHQALGPELASRLVGALSGRAGAASRSCHDVEAA
jgi:hypothetical protein